MANDKLVNKENLKAFRQAFQKAIEDGDIVAAKALVSKQLENVSDESGSYQDKPFLFQATGTDSNTTETPTAPIAKHLELRGNTAVWNQLAGTSTNESNLTITNNNGTYTINGTADANAHYIVFYGIPCISGHKYLGLMTVKNFPQVSDTYAGIQLYITTNTQIVGEKLISTIPENGQQYFIGTANATSNGQFRFRANSGLTFTNTEITPQLFDLTNIFGSGKEPTTLLEFNRLYHLTKYAHNAGELKSCKSNKLIMTVYNQFESLNQFIKVIAGQTYRLMYWNGTALAGLTSGSIEEYDGEQNLIQTTTYDNLSELHTLDNNYPDNGDKGIILTNYTQWVKIVSSSNSNILFNLAWDGSRNDFETFVKHEYTLPNVELRSAGSIYDSYYPDGTKIQRIDSVDLGTLNWIYRTPSGGNPHFSSAGLQDKLKLPKNNSWSNYSAFLSVKNFTRYAVAPMVYGTFIDNSIAVDNVGNLYIQTSDYTDAASFKAAMSGVILYYELKDPITTKGNQTFPENVEVDDFGTMEFTSSETESASNPIIPQGNRFFYPADYSLLIDDLNNYTNGDVTVLAKKSDLGDKVDKTSDPDKVYGTDSQGNQTTYDADSFGQVDDVQINGVSIVLNKIANIVIDSSLNSSSDNAVKNSVVTLALDNKSNKGIARLI